MRVLVSIIAFTLATSEAMAPKAPRMPKSPGVVSSNPFAREHRGALRLASGAALGSVLQGFTMGIIAGSLPPIVAEFGLQQRSGVQGLIAASATYGAIFGAFGSGRLGDMAGRRGSLLISSAAFLVGGVVVSTSTSVGLLVFGRVVSGFAAGLASSTVNPYIAECSAPEVRGAMLTLPQLGVSGGILLSYFVALAAKMLGADWRLMLGSALLPALLQAIAMLLLPESPRWLLTQRKDEVRIYIHIRICICMYMYMAAHSEEG